MVRLQNKPEHTHDSAAVTFTSRIIMSRMFVKDIPEFVRMDQLRELFSGKGEITDVKLMHNTRFGLFALIDFRTDHEAQEAVQCFNRSYIDTSIITCELVPLDFDYSDQYADEFTLLPPQPRVLTDKLVFDPCRLFIFYVPSSTTEMELEELFSPFGTVLEVSFVLFHSTKRSTGKAFVSFDSPQSADSAMENLDGSFFKGMLMTIVPAVQMPSINEDENNASIDQGSKTIKQLREEESKVVDATFIRPDTVNKQLKNGKNVQMVFGPTVCSNSCSV